MNTNIPEEIELKNPERKYTTMHPEFHEVQLLNILGNGVHFKDRYIEDRERLQWVLGVLKKEGKKIVYTSGVYDMLHEGHAKYLEIAKQKGDILVVAVDSDAYTRLRKVKKGTEQKAESKNRPFDPFEVRVHLLSHIRSVDILTKRDINEHPDQIIVDLLPDVAVFSRSTKDVENFEQKIRNNLADYCGEIIFLDPQSADSTTARLGRLAKDGAIDLANKIKNAVNGSIDDYLGLSKEGGVS